VQHFGVRAAGGEVRWDAEQADVLYAMLRFERLLQGDPRRVSDTHHVREAREYLHGDFECCDDRRTGIEYVKTHTLCIYIHFDIIKII